MSQICPLISKILLMDEKNYAGACYNSFEAFDLWYFHLPLLALFPSTKAFKTVFSSKFLSSKARSRLC
jgi:hypothetical protein